jgi:putative Mg2+ transporter-C (MgtC) family protein
VNLLDVIGADRFDVLPHLVALTIAYVLALPLGWNREREERSAGIRTFPLVAVASCGFVQASEGIAAPSPEAMARVVEGIITGIGFIGGGAILHLKASVKGTATAASLWVTGAIGVSVGLGKIDVAVMLALFGFVTLYLLAPLKRTIERESRPGEGDAGDGEPRRPASADRP